MAMTARLLALLFSLQAMVTGPLVDNDYVRVFKNAAPCATGEPVCGERVFVALGPVEVNGQKLDRGEIKVFSAGERYTAPKAGNFLEVVIKSNHPKAMPLGAGSPPPPKNKILYDGKDFTVFAERMNPGEYDAPHSHNVRLAIFLNDTMVEQWTDGKDETRELIPDVVMWRPAVVHASKDVGQLPISNLLLEFKP
jgi:hypothetical protein